MISYYVYLSIRIGNDQNWLLIFNLHQYKIYTSWYVVHLSCLCQLHDVEFLSNVWLSQPIAYMSKYFSRHNNILKLLGKKGYLFKDTDYWSLEFEVMTEKIVSHYMWLNLSL